MIEILGESPVRAPRRSRGARDSVGKAIALSSEFACVIDAHESVTYDGP